MGDNDGEMWQYAVYDPFSETAMNQPLDCEIPQTGPTRYNTEQGSVSGSGLPLHIQGPMMGNMRFEEQGPGLDQANNMVEADFTAAVTGRPVTGHDNGIQRLQGLNMLQIKPTGHKTEQGSGSGLPQANTVETEATAAVPGRPGQKRKREINSADRSKNFRDKKKKEADKMKERIQWFQEKTKELEKDLNESNRKVDDLHEKMHKLKETLAESKKANNDLQNLTTRLSQTVLNMSSLPEENRRLQADMDRLMRYSQCWN